MAERIVTNTGPLIALAKAEALDVAARLPLEFICPPQVHDELATGVRLGHLVVEPEWLRVIELSSPPPALALAAVDLGEAAVIQLACEQNIPWVCMDDWKGRRAALAVGLNVTGTLGLLMKAKSLEIIPAIRPFVDRLLNEGGWFNPELVRRVLGQVGE